MNAAGPFLIVGVGAIGAIFLGKILNTYAEVFGVFKAYLVCIPACLFFSELMGAGESGPSAVKMIAGLAGSYLLALILTRKLSPLVWVCMILAGFGWTLRLILSFVGIAMPIVVKKAQEDVDREAERTQQRIEEQRRRDEIQGNAYREFGKRGELNSNGTMWREDSSKEWIKVNSSTGKPDPNL